ncbi:MAG: transmembrane glucosamine N-acetyltransferase NagX [Endozoicomonas sp.]
MPTTTSKEERTSPTDGADYKETNRPCKQKIQISVKVETSSKQLYKQAPGSNKCSFIVYLCLYSSHPGPLKMQQDGSTPPDKKRLISLDALRGLDMFYFQGGKLLFSAVFILTGWPAWNDVNLQTIHAPWHGFTLNDLVFPLFIFLSGVAIGISLKRIEKLTLSERLPFYKKATKRLFLLCLLGIIFNHGRGQGIPPSLEEIRYASVLGRIGIVGFLATMLAWHTSIRTQGITAVIILIGYWFWLCYIPVPNASEGPLTPDGCWNAWIDQNFLPGVTFMNQPYDPEGLLSNIPAVVNATLGIITGHFIKTSRESSDWKLVSVLLAAGTISIILGWIWNPLFPVNKNLWTSSYVLVTAGWSSVLLAFFYILFDIFKWRKLAYPLIIFGTNSILIYVSASLFDWNYMTTNLFGGIINALPDNWQPLALIIALLTMKMFFLNWLYRRKIFVRL